MKKYKNILVFQRPDSQATEAMCFATKLAQQSPDSRVHVIDVQPKLTAFWDELLDKDLYQQQKEARVRQLSELAQSFSGDLEFICKVLTGRPVTQLVRHIQENDIDLVVKGGGATTDQSILSSLDHRIVRQCPTDVVVVSESKDSSLPNAKGVDLSPNVIVAINPIDDAVENEMNIRLLQAGEFLAQTFNLQLNVVSAVKPSGIQWAHNDDAVNEGSRFESKALDRGRKCLQEALNMSQVSMKIPNKILEFTEPESLILEQVNRLQPDFLLMGSVVRGWARGLLVGSVTERVSHELPCSLVALRPDEAISTVADRI